ncbi:MAG: cell wall hydrolase [Halofilum sp. (in: g-proteobacteria)]
MFLWFYNLTDRARTLPAEFRDWLADLRYRCDTSRVVVVGVTLSFIASVGFIVHLVVTGYTQRYAEQARRTDLRCLAENIYHEARGEPYAGRVAVAEVTLNRVASPRFPHSVCAVVHQLNRSAATSRQVAAFSWTLEDVNGPRGSAWQRAMAVAEEVYDGEHTPVVPDSHHYHATYVEPRWAQRMSPLVTIGNHVFYP